MDLRQEIAEQKLRRVFFREGREQAERWKVAGKGKERTEG